MDRSIYKNYTFYQVYLDPTFYMPGWFPVLSSFYLTFLRQQKCPKMGKKFVKFMMKTKVHCFLVFNSFFVFYPGA